VNSLKDRDECLFLISPKGTIVKREWRSGYYHVARELDANLRVAGLDYEHKRVVVSDEISSKEEEPVVREFLLENLSQIVPLYPEQEVVQIRPHRKSSLFDIDRVLFIGAFVISIGIKLFF
jgi:hypothetical protein